MPQVGEKKFPYTEKGKKAARKEAADRWLNFCKLNPGHSLCKTRKKPKAAKTKRGVEIEGGGATRKFIGSDPTGGETLVPYPHGKQTGTEGHDATRARIARAIRKHSAAQKKK